MRPETPAFLAALASAGLLARRDPRHRPIAALLGARLALAGIRYALAPLIVGKPYHGAARWAWAGDAALAGVAWYAAEAWAVWVVFAKKGAPGDFESPSRGRPRRLYRSGEALPDNRPIDRAEPRTEDPISEGAPAETATVSSDHGASLRTSATVILSLAALTASLFAAYPLLRTLPPWWPLAPVIATLAAQLAAVTVAALRRPLPRLSPPVACAGIVVASTVAEVLAGPWAQLQPWRDWYTQGAIDVAALGGIAAVSVWGWWRVRGA